MQLIRLTVCFLSLSHSDLSYVAPGIFKINTNRHFKTRLPNPDLENHKNKLKKKKLQRFSRRHFFKHGNTVICVFIFLICLDLISYFMPTPRRHITEYALLPWDDLITNWFISTLFTVNKWPPVSQDPVSKVLKTLEWLVLNPTAEPIHGPITVCILVWHGSGRHHLPSLSSSLSPG